MPKTREPKEYFALPKFNLVLLKQLLSEFLATFIYVFIIGGNVLTENVNGNTTGQSQLFSTGMANFLVATGLTYSFGQLSGGHFNPLVTAGLMFALRMNWIVGMGMARLAFCRLTP